MWTGPQEGELRLGSHHPAGQDQGVLPDLRRGGQWLHHPHGHEGQIQSVCVSVCSCRTFCPDKLFDRLRVKMWF